MWLFNGLSVDYLTFHTERYEISQEQLENTRLTATKNSPMMEAIERVVDQVDSTVLETLVPRLNTLIRKGVGLPTKAGCARFVYLLAQKVPQDLKPHADSILKALTSGIHDRSPVTRKAFASAIGHISKLASDEALRRLIEQVHKMYIEGEDEETRSISGLTILEISRQAPDRLKNYHSVILPIAYLGTRDDTDSIKKVWEEVWEENTAGSSGALRLYNSEMMDVMEKLMEKTPSWGLKKQVAGCLEGMAKGLKSGFEGRVGRAVRILGNALSGRTWEGKEVVVNALGTVVVEGKGYFETEEGRGVVGEVVKILIREGKKNNKAYKRHSIEAMGRGIDALDVDRYVCVMMFPTY